MKNKEMRGKEGCTMKQGVKKVTVKNGTDMAKHERTRRQQSETR